MTKLLKVFALCLFGAAGSANCATTLVYLQKEVNPSSVWGYMPPWNIPIYVPGGPYLISRGVGFDTIHQKGDAKQAGCTGFVAEEDRYIHGVGPMVMQSYGRQTGISLSGPGKTDDPYISALYVDYFNSGDDFRPWRDANSLVLETQVSVPQVKMNIGDVGYVQYSMLLEDATSGKFVWWVWQLHDNRANQPLEFIGVDVTPDGGDFAYVATSFAPGGLKYSTTRPGSSYFAHTPWSALKWFGSKITQQNFRNGVNAIAAANPSYTSMSRNPKDYKIRTFYFYPEIYLANRNSDARICTQSFGAILRTE